MARFPSLCLGVDGGDAISWTRSRIAVPKLEDPSQAFQLLFKPEPKSANEARRTELAENESVLSLIAQDAKRVAPLLDRWDREKMDEFIGAMRDFERANASNIAWLDKPLPVTNGKTPKWGNDGCMDRVRANFDIAALALQADATRIITLNIGGSLPVTNIPGIDRGYHDLSHSGKDPYKLRQLHVIETALMA